MRRSSALLVSLLLLAGAGAAVPPGAGADAPSTEMPSLVVSMNGSANYLEISPDTVSRTDTATNDLSLSTAIASDTGSLHTELTHATFDRAFEESTTDAEKRTAIRNAIERIEERTDALQRRDRAAVRGYTNGVLTAADFTRERARIHSTAAGLRTTTQHVDRVGRTDSGFSLSTRLRARLAALGAELEVLQGQVSERVDSAVVGDSPGQQTYVEASDDSYTMAYVADGTYVRETYLGNERKPNESDAFAAADEPAINLATNRGYALYPWVTNNSVSPNSFGPFGSSGIYRFTVDFASGELTAHIDGATTNVFRESQRHRPSAIPVSESRTAVNDSLHVRVNRTYETGPMELSLTRNDTGVPVDGTVTVDGTQVGNTGDDGTLWLVEPRGTVHVEAAADDANVSVSLPG